MVFARCDRGIDMPLAFDSERWEEMRENNRLWRRHRLGRPLLQIGLQGRDPGRPMPATPSPDKTTTAFNLAYSPEDIVDRWDWDLSCHVFMGDGFPHVWTDFGPGVASVFLGGRPEVGMETIWFYPGEFEGREVADIRFDFRPDNIWYRRVYDISRAAMERWQGQVLVGMTDLGGTLDIISTFRPGEKLLYDLYDHPREIERLTWEVHDAWFKCYDGINQALFPHNPGHSSWAAIYSEGPGYMLQCDFAYMIGPDMFNEFVMPELVRSCERLEGNAFYHLDGPGQLPHLDALLSIESLAGIQWVPGAGNPPPIEWPEVYRRILDAGKLTQMWGTPRDLDLMARSVGSVDNVVMLMGGRQEDEAEYRDCVRRYGGRA